MLKPLTQDYDLTADQTEWTAGFLTKKAFIPTHISSIIAGKIERITVKVNCILYECHLLSSLPQHDNPSYLVVLPFSL